jgi:hypothetical protein
MKRIDFIRKFPEIKEKDGKYYLFLGIVNGFSAKEILAIVDDCLEQDIFKRKILLKKILISAKNWSRKQNEALFKKIYDSKDSLPSYFKKESASMMLMALFPFVLLNYQNKLAKNFAQSKYKNNRKRIYKYFYENWTLSCQRIIESAWNNFKDEEAIRLIIAKMPKRFLRENKEELLEYFDEEELVYDFFGKILRNKLYVRLYNEIIPEIEKLKKNDPISYIAIKKDRGEKLDISWAIKIYSTNSRSRFLARWYSDIGLWDEILKKKPNFISDLKI